VCTVEWMNELSLVFVARNSRMEAPITKMPSWACLAEWSGREGQLSQVCALPQERDYGRTPCTQSPEVAHRRADFCALPHHNHLWESLPVFLLFTHYQSGGFIGTQRGGITGTRSSGFVGTQSGGITGSQSGGITGSWSGGITGSRSGGITGSQSGRITGTHLA
jgi:hypothetical protein